jgi:purine-binding chemotaxis protein CheW
VTDTIVEPRPAEPGSSALSGGGRFLTFTLAGEVYALDILQISEIIEFRSLTVVPMMPPFIRGVINLRGRVLPVVDLAARFGQAGTEVGRRTSIIVVETADNAAESEPAGGKGQQGIGIMVDAVNKVVHLGREDIEPAPAFGVGIRTDFIAGMAKHDGFIVVLDIERVLSIDNMVLLANSTAESTVTPIDEPAP